MKLQELKQLTKKICNTHKNLEFLTMFGVPHSELLEALEKLQDIPEKSRLKCAVRYAEQSTEYFTGCAISLPLTDDCRECPYWSEELFVKKCNMIIGD